MNLAQMLAATVLPLSAREPSCQKRQREKAKAKARYIRAAQNMNEAKQQRALERYRSAWRDEEWVGTAVIERRLGMGRSCCLPTLRKWEDMALLESRQVVGANGLPNRRLGFEWRWL